MRKGQNPAKFVKDVPKPEQITQAAIAMTCPVCIETVRWFVSLYGAEAGNLALKFCATAGVWLGGSIAEDLLHMFRGDVFLSAFTQKGPPRIREMLAKVPIDLIKFELNGLYGAARSVERYIPFAPSP